jgi:SpoVK/Ycf46/Vps4 family AAA+-type ATPase
MPIGWERQTDTIDGKIERAGNSLNVFDQSAEEVTTNFAPRNAIRSIEDLVVSSAVRARIETALNRLRFHDTLYNKWNLKSIDPFGRRTVINLFGQPGTGKTFCAEAIANYLKKKIIDVNYAEIESKYVGDTSKNIVEAFRGAAESEAVLFFDEADSILGKRMTNVTQSADHSVNVSRAVMLKQLDSFDGVVIFATNLAQNYDSAFVRRILTHIEFELPDKECLIKLWKYLLVKEIPLESDLSPEWLAAQSAGLSGGDLLNVVIASSSRAVAREAEKQKVCQSDITEEISFIRNAKRKVGRAQSRVVETNYEPSDLPKDVLEKYLEVAGEDNGNNGGKKTNNPSSASG